MQHKTNPPGKRRIHLLAINDCPLTWQRLRVKSTGALSNLHFALRGCRDFVYISAGDLMCAMGIHIICLAGSLAAGIALYGACPIPE